jgi:hypothetical protein
MLEIYFAESQLVRFMDTQLADSNLHHKSIFKMYIGFVSGGTVMQTPEDYDSQYLYVI